MGVLRVLLALVVLQCSAQGLRAELARRTEAMRQTWRTVANLPRILHYDLRLVRNNRHGEVTLDEVQKPGSGWTRLPASMSRFHDNGRGKPELKFVHTDGREAVFDGYVE